MLLPPGRKEGRGEGGGEGGCREGGGVQGCFFDRRVSGLRVHFKFSSHR